MKSQLIQKLFPMIMQLTDSNLKKSLLIAFGALLMYVIKRRMHKLKIIPKNNEEILKNVKVKASVDRKFLKKLLKLIKIAIPRFLGRETLSIGILTSLLVVRTILSIQIADVNGSIVKSIVRINFYDFIYRIFELGLYSFPSSVVNSALDHLNKKIALYMRENITKYFHEKYLNKMCFYQVNNI